MEKRLEQLVSTWKHPQALNATYIFIKRGMFFVYACIARMDFLDKIQGVPKKMSFLRKIAITTLKLIQNAKVGSV